MIKTPGAVPIDDHYLLDHLTLVIIGNESNDSEFSISDALHSPGLSMAFGVTTIPKLRVITSSESRHWARSESGDFHQTNPELLISGSQPPMTARHLKKAEERLNIAQRALDLRVRLGQITNWTGYKTQEAIMLSN